jgi:hypothetical protein
MGVGGGGGSGMVAAASTSSATSPSLAPRREPSILMRHVKMDQRAVQAVLDRVEDEFLDVDRSVAGLEQHDPTDPVHADYM